MKDLAETVDDLICSFEAPTGWTMDTIAMLVFGWLVVGLALLWIGRLIYGRISAAAAKRKHLKSVSQERLDGHLTDRGAAVVSSAMSAGGAYVPPTPPTRRRLLARQSPQPQGTASETRKVGRLIPAPRCTGPDNQCVSWVNRCLQWLYNDLVIVNEVVGVWIQALNEHMRKAMEDQGVGVELIRILPETPVPVLSNIFAEINSKDDVTITCDCDASSALQLKCTRKKGDKVETSHYRANVNRFRARLNISCVTDKLQTAVNCNGWPDVKISLAPVGNIKNNTDEQHLQDVISEILVDALRNMEVHLNLAQYPTCPKLRKSFNSIDGAGYPYYYDSQPVFSSTPNESVDGVAVSKGAKRLLIKVLRADRLGGPSAASEPTIEPYCIIEIDEPPQKNQTTVKKNTNCPQWDEHFLFDLYPATSEVLFEIYDHSKQPQHQFLGLAIVGVDELLINPSQRQIIALQNRPYEKEPAVSGAITVEFLFIESADISMPSNDSQPFKIKQSIRAMTLPHNAHKNDSKNFDVNPSIIVSDVNGGYEANKAVNGKNTLVIHSLQRQPSQRVVKAISDGVSIQEVLSTSSPSTPTPTSAADLTRGRSKRRRDFFGTIRRRLARSRNRSNSMGPENGQAMRSSNGEQQQQEEGGGETSRRSSISEASGLSSASARTYLNEASTLVLETNENGIKKHYLVPLSIAQKAKWKKKGVKLHVYNDHTFIARHLPGGLVCPVCNKSIVRRLGKQGYECRDCSLRCHKHCHVKVSDNCPTSTIHNIELSYITNPYTNKNLSIL